MSKRARHVGKTIQGQPRAFNYTEWIEEDSTRHEIHQLLAATLASTDAKVTVALMLSNRAWRDALKPEVVAYMKRFNETFREAQIASRVLDRQGDTPVSINAAVDEIMKDDANTLSSEELNDGSHPLVVAKIQEMNERLVTNRAKVAKFRAIQVFPHGIVQGALKKVAILLDPQSRSDPRVDGAREITYKLGDDTGHAYAAMAWSSCEVNRPLGLKPRGHSEFVPTPHAHGTSRECFRLLYTTPEAVNAQCISYNILSANPLAPVSNTSVRKIGQPLVALSQPCREKNNRLLKYALLHSGVSEQISASAIDGRLALDDKKLVEKLPRRTPPGYSGNTNQIWDEMQNMNTFQDAYTERVLRVLWLRKHPTMPADFSMESKLKISATAFKYAEADLARFDKKQEEIANATQLAHKRKLLGDLNGLLENRPGLVAAEATTVEAINILCPGFATTVSCLIDCYGQDIDHICEIGLSNLVVHAAEMAVNDVRRYDQMFCENGNLASGLAYAWISGLFAGAIPTLKLAEFGLLLNDDPVNLGYGVNEMENYVTTMHLFDALQWNQICVRKAPAPGAAGGSSDPLPRYQGDESRVCYTIGIGVADSELVVQQSCTYPTRRVDWERIREQAAKMMDDCDMEASFPIVPSQGQINELFDESSSAIMALNWIEVMARTLCYWPRTRAFGLDVLTNRSTRGLVDAVAKSPVDMQLLGLARAIKVADGEPME